MEYFKHFPTINYQFGNRTVQMTDLLSRVTFTDLTNVEADVLYTYLWQEGDEIDSIADRYYETVDFWWLVLASAGVFDPFTELPIEQLKIEPYLISKYRRQALEAGYNDTELDILTYIKGTTFEYRDSDGDVIDLDTFQSLPPSERRVVSIFDYEVEQNEQRRSVNLLTISLASTALDQLQEQMRVLQ